MDVLQKKGLILILFAVVLPMSVAAQGMKDILTLQNEHLSSVERQKVPLAKELQQLEKKYGVQIFYISKSVNGKYVYNLETRIDQKQGLESILTNLLHPHSMTFRKLAETSYIVMEHERPNIQELTVTGLVTDATSGEPLPGVNVVIEGTNTGTATNMDGEYSLEVSGPDEVLVFSFIGYTTQQITVGNRQVVDVSLEQDLGMLDEVVVIGYGTVRKTDLAGAVSTINNTEFERVPVTNPLMSLQGRSAGLRIIPDSGIPGASASIRIRGEQSIEGSNSPIFVVDGSITSDIDHLNSQDIESVSVLKDASAVAIYGSRGANGVILITTKRGSNNTEPTITFHTYGAVQQESNLQLELLNADEFLEIYTEAYNNIGNTPPWDQEDLAQYEGVNSDWLGAIMGTGYQSNSNLSISGGSDRSTYFVSTNYTNHQGMVVGTNYNKINLTLNTDHQIKDWITFGNSLNLFSSEQNRLTGQYNGAIQKVPITRIYEEDDSYGRIRNTQLEHMHQSPLFLAENMNDRIERGVLGNLYLTLSLLEGLEFTARGSAKWTNGYATSFNLGVDPSLGWEGSTINELEKVNDETLFWQTDFLLNYRGSIGEDHSITGLLGYSREEQSEENLEGFGNGTPSNDIRYLNAVDPTSVQIDNDFSDWAFIGMFGRVGYTYKDRYIVNASVRRDGSSRLSPGFQYGIFPSASVAWRISGESFMDDFDWLNELKLRASWGTVGNVLSIDTYGTKTSLSNRNYVLGQPQEPSIGYTLTDAVNTNLQWEATEKKNIGVDIEMLDNRLFVSTDFFIEDTYDLLFEQPIPMSTGLGGSPYINAGEIRNTGVELELGFRQVVGDWRYSVTANFTHFKNEVIDLEGRDLRTEGIMEGYPLESFFGYKSNGIIRTQGDLDDHPHYPGKEIGDIWLLDINGFDDDGNLTGEPDGEVNAADRTLLGDDYPSFQYGAMGIVGYKNFTLQVHLSGLQGVRKDIRGGTNLGALHYFTQWAKNHDRLILDRYHSAKNPDGQYPRVTANDAGSNLVFSDFWISDASYLRISNVNISYDFPVEFNERIGVGDLGAYVSVQNLYTFTDFYGPEVDSNADVLTGVPQPRTWTLGLRVSF